MRKEEAELAVVLALEYPGRAPGHYLHVAGICQRQSNKLNRLDVARCNGEAVYGIDFRTVDDDDVSYQKVVTGCLNAVRAAIYDGLHIYAEGFKIKHQGDPRGCSLQIVLPSGRYNSMGGKESGWVI